MFPYVENIHGQVILRYPPGELMANSSDVYGDVLVFKSKKKIA